MNKKLLALTATLMSGTTWCMQKETNKSNDTPNGTSSSHEQTVFCESDSKNKIMKLVRKHPAYTNCKSMTALVDDVDNFLNFPNISVYHKKKKWSPLREMEHYYPERCKPVIQTSSDLYYKALENVSAHMKLTQKRYEYRAAAANPKTHYHVLFAAVNVLESKKIRLSLLATYLEDLANSPTGTTSPNLFQRLVARCIATVEPTLKEIQQVYDTCLAFANTLSEQDETEHQIV